MIPRRRHRERPTSPQPEHRVEEHPLHRMAGAGGDELDEIRREPGAETDGEGPHPPGPEAPQHASVPEGHGDGQVRPEQQRQAGQQPRRQEEPAGRSVALVGDGPAGQQPPSGVEADDQADQAEGDRPVPRQGGEPDRRGGDEDTDEPGGDGDPASPRSGQDVHPEDDAEQLDDAEGALRGERHSEDLEPPGERPEAAGAVEVQEVAVGQRPVQDPLREDEHEALLHRRALVAEQGSQRHGERRQDDAHRHGTAPLGPPAVPGRGRARRCRRHRRFAGRRVLRVGAGAGAGHGPTGSRAWRREPAVRAATRPRSRGGAHRRRPPRAPARPAIGDEAARRCRSPPAPRGPPRPAPGTAPRHRRTPR